MGNSFIFPVPHCDYTRKTLEPFFQAIPVKEEYYSSKKDKTKVIHRTIPSLLIKSSTKSKHLIIYLHGNSEDLGKMYPRLLNYYEQFQIDILAPEYPGYGIYKDSVSAERMIRDAQHVVDYATRSDGLNYSAENVILMGRSLGTGVAIQLAARCPYLRGIILISPFTSIRDVAKNVAGSISKLIIPDIFQSHDIISEVRLPVLFIHGREDDLIPFSHSVKLYESCGSSQKRLEIRDNMSHNRCREERDIIQPIEKFLAEELQITDLPFAYIKSRSVDYKLTEKIKEKSRTGVSSKYTDESMSQDILIHESKEIIMQKGIFLETVETKERKLDFQ